MSRSFPAQGNWLSCPLFASFARISSHPFCSNLDVAPLIARATMIAIHRSFAMATATTPVRTDYRNEWFEIEDATYLNLAAQCPMPKVAHRAVQSAIEWKKYPHRISDAAYFEVPICIRVC